MKILAPSEEAVAVEKEDVLREAAVVRGEIPFREEDGRGMRSGEGAKPAPEETSAPVSPGSAKPAPEETSAPVSPGSAKPAPEETSVPVSPGSAKPAPEETSVPVSPGSAKPAPEETSAPVSPGSEKPSLEETSAPVSPGLEKPSPANSEAEYPAPAIPVAEAPSPEEVYARRLSQREEELRWLYMELYEDGYKYDELLERMKDFALGRGEDLQALDAAREADPEWYKRNDLLGMMLYIDNFAGNLQGVESRLDYLERCQVNYVHLMPFLDTVEGRSDGGYAVADFTKVQEKLGTMEDLERLSAQCRRRGICLCMDFVLNHTSQDHEWARRARAGEGEYRNRYFFYDNYDIPRLYEQTMPQVFPTTAPGNFTYLEDAQAFVMTTFYPYQWDLNYHNPVVFNEMMANLLFLANKGMDVIRLDAVPYIWKELHTQCRNLPKVHTIVRMMRLIGEIVCPGVVLLGEVVMEPEKVVPYFGTTTKPECHMLYNVTTMATTWHTVATRDVGLLRRQLDIVNGLPKEYTFLNYLRCHDDIGWGLDYASLQRQGIGERSHKQYLNDFFQGVTGFSNSRGVLYNADPVSGDARFCGTTASMCGVEKAGFEQDDQAMDRAIDLHVMLHAYMFAQSGIPILYSGDEIGQVNDYSYKEDPLKVEDSRYIHRGAMRWENAARIDREGTVEARIFGRLARLQALRRREQVFVCQASCWTVETWDQAILGIGRYYAGEKLISLFNFSEHPRTAWINEEDGPYVDLISGAERAAKGVDLPAYGFVYLKRSIKE